MKGTDQPRHFIVSLFKSALRMGGALMFVLSDAPVLIAGGVAFFVAEVLGVIEEIV
jgi:hypothetical protein